MKFKPRRGNLQDREERSGFRTQNMPSCIETELSGCRQGTVAAPSITSSNRNTTPFTREEKR